MTAAATPRRGRGQASGAERRELFDLHAGLWYNIRAKTVYPVRADFSFQGSSHIIFKRPQVVTTGSVFANCPPSDTWGRTILNPGQRTGPPKTSKQKAQPRPAALLRLWTSNVHR